MSASVPAPPGRAAAWPSKIATCWTGAFRYRARVTASPIATADAYSIAHSSLSSISEDVVVTDVAFARHRSKRSTHSRPPRRTEVSTKRSAGNGSTMFSSAPRSSSASAKWMSDPRARAPYPNPTPRPARCSRMPGSTTKAKRGSSRPTMWPV
jgi:hypothetical protein